MIRHIHRDVSIYRYYCRYRADIGYAANCCKSNYITNIFQGKRVGEEIFRSDDDMMDNDINYDDSRTDDGFKCFNDKRSEFIER